MKRVLSSVESDRPAVLCQPLANQTSPRTTTSLDSVCDIRAHLEQRTCQPLHLAAEQEEACHSAREGFVIRDLLV